MIKSLYHFSLNAMEKLDSQTIGYKFARKIYDRAFAHIYDMSPYESIDEHDKYQDDIEYRASQNEENYYE